MVRLPCEWALIDFEIIALEEDSISRQKVAWKAQNISLNWRNTGAIRVFFFQTLSWQTYHTWFVQCLQPRALPPEFEWPGLPARRWISVPARCGSGGPGTASLYSSHWTQSPTRHRSPRGEWRHPRSSRPPTPFHLLHRQQPFHSLQRGRILDFKAIIITVIHVDNIVCRGRHNR